MSSETPEQRHRAGVLEAAASAGGPFAAAVVRIEAGAPINPAILCALAHLGGCRGPLQADHPIPKQRLKHWHQMQESLGRPLPCLFCQGHGDIWTSFGGSRPVQCGHCHGTGATSLETLIADARNGWLLCEKHHHHPHITVPRGWLPASVSEFAHDFRLGWSLERDYPA